jgi:hypothetical protein
MLLYIVTFLMYMLIMTTILLITGIFNKLMYFITFVTIIIVITGLNIRGSTVDFKYCIYFVYYCNSTSSQYYR